jgi:hypothetical protein
VVLIKVIILFFNVDAVLLQVIEEIILGLMGFDLQFLIAIYTSLVAVSALVMKNLNDDVNLHLS